MKIENNPKKISLSYNPKAIASPEIFWALYLDYKTETKLNPILVHDFVGKDGKDVHREKERPMTIEGFENYIEDHLGLGTIQQYLENRDGRYGDYVSVVARVRREIRQDMIEGGLTGIYHPNLTARINGITEKTESTISQDVKLLNIDPL